MTVLLQLRMLPLYKEGFISRILVFFKDQGSIAVGFEYRGCNVDAGSLVEMFGILQ